ncbi:hypothetical protein TTHERM_000760321 (macronuclear) [Tetrahymena thermophila SB210]|uniref:Uncharacterized protein n=1 Tax=Tetrahymena thermophila (strain SB210) TaxID=312017 RepID=W7WY04_TETTS|nr:hypothetical protein TTHERM_000760321 [Tetrahymena thermophila SB210]EWS71740.1 hypothetical protein TTHERM_000760321 [Tetrahymena thermophila SB210]|eukprot:XP_012655726.1 hypothetical protein TTHERM_000760321 [Tetrahymena thermophila SB210]
MAQIQRIFNKNGIIFNGNINQFSFFRGKLFQQIFKNQINGIEATIFYKKKLAKRRINVDLFYTTFALELIIQKFLKQVFQHFYFPPAYHLQSRKKQQRLIIQQINFTLFSSLIFRSVLSNERILVNQILQMITQLFQTK